MAAKNLVNKTLKAKLIDLIKIRGPLTVSDYMKIVLTNPESGFYMNEDVFGVKGHFTTNPEISQTFGEILGAWIHQEWSRFGCPKPLQLVEFGPGRGTLMADITRTLTKFRDGPESVQLQLIEVSPRLQEIQKGTLEKEASISANNLVNSIEWHSSIQSVAKNENGFTAFIAHEFLDALPIHKFVRDPSTKKWRDLLIDYDQEANLRFCIARQPSLTARLLIPENFQGDHLEVCPEAALCLEKVAKRLNETKRGCMLVCDYGFEDTPTTPTIQGTVDHEKSRDLVLTERATLVDRDTFRAFKEHESWPPLKDPGLADLTSDVDFGYLKGHLKDKALLFGSVNQRQFLLNCGLQARLNILLEKADDRQKEDLISGADLMTREMGDRYRFLAIFPKGFEHLFDGDPPAGFGDMTSEPD